MHLISFMMSNNEKINKITVTVQELKTSSEHSSYNMEQLYAMKGRLFDCFCSHIDIMNMHIFAIC